jgi:hypothetical protein
MKVLKTTCVTPQRKLSHKYTVENQDLTHAVDLEQEIFKSLADELQKEIDNEIITEIFKIKYKEMNWHQVYVKNYQQVSGDWVRKYIKKPHSSFNHYWYFECGDDANFFILKWGS